ncbi:hypothetical protein [Brevibacterium litoralis]|uniref:hypothetical protein n=1 Tax=Brevibacterium litoralis TaxID=3138935 RepID=UPI0032EEDB3A
METNHPGTPRPDQPTTGEIRRRRGIVRTRRRMQVLWWIALVAGVGMSAWLHWLQIQQPTHMDSTASTRILVTVFVDLALGTLALGLLPAALRHDPMEVQESYVGPPSALVASLVILCVWMVSWLAAPAGAIVLISVTARLSPGWTLPAIGASMLSVFVHELTFDVEHAGVQATMVFWVLVLTLILVAMGSVRGLMLRRLL